MVSLDFLGKFEIVNFIGLVRFHDGNTGLLKKLLKKENEIEKTEKLIGLMKLRDENV